MNRLRVGAGGVFALLVGLALTTAVPGAVGPDTADAAGLHRAGVVVDPGDGSGPHTACVWFEEESISGLELLARSSFDAGVRAFGGLGGAVCSIDGAGCSADSACLTCGGRNYWAYATANPGDRSFAQAPAGAGGRTVTDGAVDGWRWGSGDPPAFLAVDRICPAAPPAPAPPPPAPVPVPAPVAPVARPEVPAVPNEVPAAPAAPPARGSVATTAPSTATTSSTAPSTTVVASTVPSTTSTSTSTPIATDEDADPAATVAAAAIRPEAENTDESGGTGVLAIVAVVIAAGLGGTAVWRLRRSG